MSNRIEGSLYINGALQAQSMVLPANAVSDTNVTSNAQIQASKLQHGNHVTYAQEGATESVAGSYVIHTARATGTVIAFEVGCQVLAVTDKACTVDLQKSTAGGAFATVLTAPVTLNAASTVRTLVVGTITSDSYVDGDIFKVVIVNSGSTGSYPKGVFATLTVHENPAI